MTIIILNKYDKLIIMYSFVETEGKEKDNFHKQLFKMNITMPSMLTQEVNKRLGIFILFIVLDATWE
jgi:hypothetical protein